MNALVAAAPFERERAARHAAAFLEGRTGAR